MHRVSVHKGVGRKVDVTALHVLVVDDHKYARTMLRACLNAFGIRQVSEANGAVQALDVLQGAPPVDVILVDKEMPVVSGIELTQLVRRGEMAAAEPDMPIIMVSGHTDPHTVHEARAAGIDAFLAKPVPADKLVTRIRTVLEANPRGRHGRHR